MRPSEEPVQPLSRRFLKLLHRGNQRARCDNYIRLRCWSSSRFLPVTRFSLGLSPSARSLCWNLFAILCLSVCFRLSVCKVFGSICKESPGNISWLHLLISQHLNHSDPETGHSCFITRGRRQVVEIREEREARRPPRSPRTRSRTPSPRSAGSACCCRRPRRTEGRLVKRGPETRT